MFDTPETEGSWATLVQPGREVHPPTTKFPEEQSKQIV